MSIVAPRQREIALRVEMQQRLAERLEAADPSLRRGERVHPRNDADAPRIRRRVDARLADRLSAGQYRFPDDGHRDDTRPVEARRDLLRLRGDLTKRLLAVQLLAPGQEPQLGLLAHVQPFTTSAALIRNESANIPRGAAVAHAIHRRAFAARATRPVAASASFRRRMHGRARPGPSAARPPRPGSSRASRATARWQRQVTTASCPARGRFR